jgi:hypothetical protein
MALAEGLLEVVETDKRRRGAHLALNNHPIATLRVFYYFESEILEEDAKGSRRRENAQLSAVCMPVARRVWVHDRKKEGN